MIALDEIVTNASRHELDDAARAVWSALARGEIDDATASTLAERIAARRIPGNYRAPTAARVPAATSLPARRPTPPERRERILRRRRVAASGALPPKIACHFSTAELAALAVVVAEVRERGACTLPLAAIAARAGCSRTSVQNALRAAVRLGLVTVEERRRRWNRNAPNVVKIVSADWLTWIARGPRRGGFKNFDGMNTEEKKKEFSRGETASARSVRSDRNWGQRALVHSRRR